MRIRTALLLVVAATPAMARNCVGDSRDNNYYPTINNSFPAANIYQRGNMKLYNRIYPGGFIFDVWQRLLRQAQQYASQHAPLKYLPALSVTIAVS